MEVGPYRILETLGEGGMGIVYAAEQRQPIHRRVALKVIKWGMDTKEVLARFDIERQALAMLDHPNIAKVLDAGATREGRPFFAMELVRGLPITRYSDTSRLPLRERIEVFLQACAAVQHAHDRGILHRDIKPSNILVTEVDGHAVAKVIDFGMAKAINQRLTEKTLFTEEGRIIGTPEYMSPEQAELSAQDVDNRTDVFSLGVLLYELIAGTLPFDFKSVPNYMELQRRIREDEPPTPSKRISSLRNSIEEILAMRRCRLQELAGSLRRGLDAVTMKAMAKQRRDRYPSCAELAADLRRFLADEPVLARKAGGLVAAQRTVRRFHRRHPSVVPAAFVASVVAVGTWLVASRPADPSTVEPTSLDPIAIDPNRSGTPSSNELDALGRLRDRYRELQNAYDRKSQPIPRRVDVIKAMADYAQGLRAAFLEPCCRYVEWRLDEYLSGGNSLDFSSNSQLVAVYGAMGDESVTDDCLRVALEQQNLWRWSPADIGKAAPTVSISEESKHLDAFLVGRRFDPTIWVVSRRRGLLGMARDKLSSGSQTQMMIAQILKEDPAARNATKEELVPLVVKQIEDASGTKVELTPELRHQIDAQRTTEVLISTAKICLRDTSSLEALRDSLADLSRPESAPLRIFRENIEALRRQGGAPGPDIGLDAAVGICAAAVGDIAGLSSIVSELAGNPPGTHVLPEVSAGEAGALAKFLFEWGKVQNSIEARINQMKDLMPNRSSQPAFNAIEQSLREILKSIMEAIAREARREMREHWNDSVGTDLQTYARCFPCRGDAADDIDVSTFVDLFCPDGKLDRELKLLSKLASIPELKTALGLVWPFEVMKLRARAIQTACFDGDMSGKPRLQFHLAMNRDKLVGNMMLTIAVGNRVSTQDGTPARILNQVRTWPIGDVGGELLLETPVEVRDGTMLSFRVPKEGRSSSPWGLLHLLADRDTATEKVATERVGNDAKVTFGCTYLRTDGTGDTVTVRCSLVFKSEGAENPLTPRFFTLDPPKHIFEADAR